MPVPTETSPCNALSSAYSEDVNHLDDFCGISIHAALSTLLKSGKYSDMTIRCKGHEYKVHQTIVCSQSAFFERVMSSQFKEARMKTVELPEDEPYLVERFIEFLYTGNYTDNVAETWDKPSISAMMDHRTVRQSLQEPACGGLGVLEFDGNALDSESDQEWQPLDEEKEEPEEEYKEDEDGDDSSEDYEGRQYDPKTGWEIMTMEEISLLSKEDGLELIARLRIDMTLPLRLYVMADKYFVPALRHVARDRFYRAAELVWEEAEYFPDIVDELYETTPSTDTAMREVVCRLVGARIHDPKVEKKMRPVMEKHREFGVGVTR